MKLTASLRAPTAVILVGLGLAGVVTWAPGCELMVQLDRSAVDAGGDAGCAICSDMGEDGSTDGQSDAGSSDGSAEAIARDAGLEGASSDSATKD